MICALVSDLHYEFHGRHAHVQIPASVETLILAGDISSASSLEDILKYYCTCVPNVVFVAGNHEYYGRGAYEQYHATISKMQTTYPNFYCLTHESGIAIINDKTFVGDTLWFPEHHDGLNQIYEKYMPDFRTINIPQKNAREWIYEENDKTVKLFTNTAADVFVSHHMPSTLLIQPKYFGSVINRFFASDVFAACKFPPKVWCFGHTHDNIDQTIDDTRFLCNPRGYPGESIYVKTYSPKIFQI